MQERARLEGAFTDIKTLTTDLVDNVELAELAEMDGDESLLSEAAVALEKLRDKGARAEVQALLSGEADSNDAFVEIHPGAGGTEAQDWAQMLLRMYSRWANSQGLSLIHI